MNKYTELEQMIHWILWDYIYSLFYTYNHLHYMYHSFIKVDKFYDLIKEYNLKITDRQHNNDCILCKTNCDQCPLNELDYLKCNTDSLFDKATDGNLEALKTIRDIFL